MTSLRPLVPLLALAAAGALDLAPVAGRRNVLDDPGFDLGGAAWRFFPWYQATDALPVFDEQVRHDGRRSIRFPGMGESVESRLYLLPAGKPVTLSAWVRGGDPATAHDGVGFSMFLISAQWKLQSLQVPVARLGQEWQRFSLTFTPPPYDNAYGASVYVRFDAHAALWLDSLQLEAGTAPTAYEPGPQIGLEDDLTDNATRPGPVRLTLRARRPEAAPATARVSARDVRGRELWAGDVALGPVGPDGIAVPVTAELPRLGVAEVRAELAGDPAPQAAAWLRIAVTDGEPVRPNPLIGIDNNPLMHLAPRVRDRERWADLLGSGCARIFFSCTNGTRKALPQDGSDFLRDAAALLSPEMQHHRPLTACLDPAPDSAISLERMRRDNKGPAEADVAPAIAAFAARSARIAAAMKDDIGCWEVLNEPNIWYIDNRRVMPAERLAAVVAGVAPAVRAAAGARIAANINGIDGDYVEALLRAPGGDAFDVLTVHPYRATPELPPLYEDLLALRARVDKLRPGLPIVATEQYYLSRGDGFANGEFERNYASEHESDQAGRTLQAPLHHLAALATPYVFFQPEDNLYRQAPQGVHWFYAATMVRQLARMLDGVRSGTSLAVHPACRAFLFRRGDGARVVSVTTREYGRRGRLAIPAGCAASDCDGNPVAGEAAIDHLPTWLRFPVGTTDEAVAKALADAAWNGFDFPLAVQGQQDGKDLVLAVSNRGTRPAAGTVEVVAAPTGWPTGKVEVPAVAPGTVHRTRLPGLPALAWDADAALQWRATCDGDTATGWARVPTMRIPRIAAGWPGSAWIALGEDHVSKDFAGGRLPHTGAADLAGRIALGWDEHGLRFAAEFSDDVAFRGTQNDGDLWQSDSLQLYLDPGDVAREGTRGFDRGDACWIFGPALAGGTAAILTRNPGDRYLGAANAETGPDPDVAATWTARPGGWTLSVELPAKTVPGLKLQPGSRFGWSVLVNDNDGQGRKPGLTLGRPGSEPYEQPWLWRCAVLGD